MTNRKKCKKAKQKSIKTIKNPKRTWIAIAIALYLTFLLLSTIPFIADRAIEPVMKDSYGYHLKYPRDGRQTHYYVERIDPDHIGKIDLIYTTSSNSLEVNVENINVLRIYCRSMYEDECQKVYGINPYDNSNYYKWYFIEKNHLNVNIESDDKIDELSFIDTPIPYEVIVNGNIWEKGEDYYYKDNSGTVLSDVPSGQTRVDIYFKPREGNPPKAILKVSKTLVPVNETITLDASNSYDIDGEIKSYIFDFGDGSYKGGRKHTYFYTEPGVYGVILTVRDNDNLIDRAMVNITVVSTSNIPKIQSRVPDQIKPEDSSPWTLNLSQYEPFALEGGVEFYWYLTGEDSSLYTVTGENSSLYTVTGENSSYAQLVFKPMPDAYGNDLVILWLRSSEDLSVSQPLWINITPVNDPPTISDIPDLILHYDDPYTFNYLPYVSDKETPRDELQLNVYDGYDDEYITVTDLNATYNYPQELVSEIIYATVIVSDGEAQAQDMITIHVTSDYVPKLVKALPDIWLYEGTAKKRVFDLDEYFTDPDDDSIYFTYGYTHMEITINPDHTVDISAESEWTGSELVTFRARDPIGALAEDTIVVTVIPVNDPPMIDSLPDLIVHYDHDYRFDLTPYVYDNDNMTEELTIKVSDFEHIRFDINNHLIMIMNYSLDYLGQSVVVRLTVFDGLDSSYQDVNVTITEDFPPELLTSLPDIVFLEDVPSFNAFDLDSYFLDIDGDVLYYTTGNKYVEIVINKDNTVDFRSPKDWFGTEFVYFRATDPTGALQQDLVLVTVLPVNDPPQFLPVPKQIGNESEQWALDLGPYIVDVDNSITELEIQVHSDYIVLSGSKLIFLGSPEIPREVEVTVDDGEYSSSQIIEIHLRLKKLQRAPTIWDLFMSLLPILLIIIIIIVMVAAIVYRKKSKFEVEEVFLIHKGGTLINHLISHAQANVDDIIFSGMFTAVQDFIKDTFVNKHENNNIPSQTNIPIRSNDWALDELKLGENKILIEQSDNAYLAVIFKGEGSKRLRKIVGNLLQKIEKKYANVLPIWDGDIRTLADTKEILSVLIKSKHTKKSNNKFEPKMILQAHNRPFKGKTPQIGQNQVRFNKTTNIQQSQLVNNQLTQTQRSITKPSLAKPVVNSPSQSYTPRTIKINMPNGTGDFEIDPNKSLLKQLADFDDMETGKMN